APRWRLGGLSGRFRRRQAESESSEIHDLGDQDEMPFLPSMSPHASFARPGTSDDEPEAASSPSIGRLDDFDAWEPTPAPEPHPDLHPALRRDLSATPPAFEDNTAREDDSDVPADPDAAGMPEAKSASPEPSTEPSIGASIEATADGTGVSPIPSTLEAPTRSKVVEERVAITPRPSLPTPPTPPVMIGGSTSAAPEATGRSTATADPADSDPPEPELATGDEVLDTPPALTRRSTPISAYLAVLTGVATLLILAFLLIEPTPRWLLVLGAGATVLGLDGTLRQTWREPFALGQETAPFLFVPALYMISVPVLIEHNVTGEATVLMGLGAGIGFGALAWAELASVRAFSAEYPQARTIVAANTYLTGFAIFSLTYVFDTALVPSLIATGIAGGMLAVEILREGEIDPIETLGLALVAGVVVAEARWLFYYMPLDTYLAGLALLLVFYLVTGLLHSYVVRALNSGVALQYSAITAAGMSLVAVARVTGLA
ncbi:MAG: hypothetical protein WD942_12040, partial [Dehalococcoidia bacterium]